jgi:predicted dehydrogenase
MKTFNWGILGTGNIARKFTKSLHLLDNARLYSVGSREPDRAEKFALEFGFTRHSGSYE